MPRPKDQPMATAPQHVLPSVYEPRRFRLGRRGREAHAAGAHPLVRRQQAEFQALQRELLASKELLPLNPQSFPGCVLSRSNPSDVARVEH